LGVVFDAVPGAAANALWYYTGVRGCPGLLQNAWNDKEEGGESVNVFVCC
jgi:hypothetical protein